MSRIPFAHGMAAHAAPGLEQFLAPNGVASGLAGQFPFDPRLPNEGGNGAALPFVQAKGRHLGGGAVGVRVLQPDRDPLLADLEANFLQAGSDIFLLDLQVRGTHLQPLHFVVQVADLLLEFVRPGVVPLSFRVVLSVIAGQNALLDLLAHLLPVLDQRVNG